MTRICGRCGAGYESYTVLVRDDFNDLCDNAHIKHKYGNVCKGCRAYLAPGHAFTGAPDVEPIVNP